MGRSSNPRHPLPAERGAKRIGAIGNIVPGDDVEVAREIARIWDWISRLRIPKVAGTGSGIQFDVANESHGVDGSGVGGILSVDTHTDVGEANNGQQFVDHDDDTGKLAGFYMTVLAGFSFIADAVNSAFNVEVEKGAAIVTHGASGIALTCIGDGAVDIEGYDNVNIYASNGDVWIQGDNTRIQLLAGGKVWVRDHLSASIFEIREDGSVHIKTGTAIVSDL